MQLLKRIPWNKGLKISETHPQMGFKKGNRIWNNLNSKASQFKLSEHNSLNTEFQIKGVPWNKDKIDCFKHTEEWKQQQSERMSGENHPLWLEDRTLLKKDRIKAYDCAYKEWMKFVKNRDGWKCRMANEDCCERLEAHHILSWIDYPELRYDINNGITLCQAHHPRGRAKAKRLISEFQMLVSEAK